MFHQSVAAFAWLQSTRTVICAHAAHAARGARGGGSEAGEGVVSTAIAVLVMAFLGVLMWELFGETLRRANTDVNDKLRELQ